MDVTKAIAVIVDCAKCGSLIPIDKSAEWELVKRGTIVEFYYCADRETCNRVCNEAIDQRREA